jgi:hypothetical protein
VVCENGGECIDGLCDCPPNYTGDNCEEQITPSFLTVNGIQVSMFPIVDDNGLPWDNSSDPDIFPEISFDGNVLYLAPNASVNADPNGVSTWIPGASFTINDIQEVHVFKLFDGDPNDEVEEMGEVFFTPYSSENDFPEVLEFTGDSITFSLQVAYTW